MRINPEPVPMTVRRVRTPHGLAGQHNGWFTVTRGAKVPRRVILGILLGKYRAKVETCSTTDPDKWSFYGDKDTPFAEPSDD